MIPDRRAASAAAWAAILISLPSASVAQIEVSPRVGVDFEHFGSTYHVTADRDTVSTVNDYGSIVGLTLRSPWTEPNRFRLDTDLHVGKETRRFGLDFDGRLERGPNAFELRQEGTVRVFDEGGAYSISSNYLQEYVRLAWERRLTERLRLRLRESLDLAWYENPDQYNLNTILHRPGADLRLGFGDLSEVRVGYQVGQRTVPDSTKLDYWRHTMDGDLSLLVGWTTSLDVSTRVDRRDYEAGSVRSSSWSVRGDVNFEFGPGDRMTYRLVQEAEVLRYDEPDDLDFDSEWLRTGFQIEVHRTLSMDLSIMPVYAFLTSQTTPDEEFTETGLEFGIDWRIGKSTWISVTDEVGRRDYEAYFGFTATDSLGTVGAVDTVDAIGGSVFSDYLYNRLTLLVTSDVSTGVSVNVFANWQPEDHRVNEHDNDTRIVSGGIEYRF